MENYYQLNEKALAIIGINLGTIEGRFETYLMLLVVVIMPLTTFQDFMYAALYEDGISFDLVNAVALTTYGIMGSTKVFTAILHRRALSKIKENLMDMFKDLDEEKKPACSKEMAVFRKISTTFVSIGVFSTLLFDILPLIFMIHTYLTQGVAIKVFSYALWYPFDKQKYFFVAYSWESFCSFYSNTAFYIIDGLIILLFGNAIVLMNRFGESLRDTISGMENTPIESRAQKIKTAVDYHNKLLSLFKSIIEIYQTPLLVNILVQTANMGMVLYIVSVSRKGVLIEPQILIFFLSRFRTFFCHHFWD